MSFSVTTQKVKGNWSFKVKDSASWNGMVIWALTPELVLASHTNLFFLFH